jgi:CDP-glucose 4,6-dehydratase
MAKKDAIFLRNPLSTRPWQHVLDPIFAYLLIGARLNEDGIKYRGAWNVGPDASSVVDVQVLTERFLQAWDSPLRIETDPEHYKHESRLLHLNCDKAHFELGWRPIWDFNQTVRQTALWYKTFLAKGADRGAMKQFTLEQIAFFLESFS